MQRPVLFFLHSLGAGRTEWSRVIALLEDRYTCVALDIPGFGGTLAGDVLGTVALSEWFAEEVARRAPSCWYAVGHSMGGKIATQVAAHARDGRQGLAGLAGVALVAASPPSPEPMDDARRARMLAWAAHGGVSRAHAHTFVADNTAHPLPEPALTRAVEDVMRCDPVAWTHWLRHGSREDVSAAVGQLRVPALILAGAEDGDLGEPNQRALNAPHYDRADVAVIEGAAHLIPCEQPHALAQHISRFVEATRTQQLPASFVDLLNAPRVVPRMRALLLERHAGPAASAPGVLNARALQVLAAVADRVLDTAGTEPSLARRIDVGLAQGTGDGWRFADLPPDALAWAQGLATLDTLAGGFVEQHPSVQDAWLQRIADSERIEGGALALSAVALARWFEDARAEIARVWMSLPTTFAAIGYDGFAVGSAGAASLGYDATGAGRHDPWQLHAAAPAR